MAWFPWLLTFVVDKFGSIGCVCPRFYGWGGISLDCFVFVHVDIAGQDGALDGRRGFHGWWRSWRVIGITCDHCGN